MAGRIAYYGGIVTNGLILDLDAAKKDSYPGTGTAWNDISGNRNNGTLTNGPTFSSNNGGSIVFDGVDDYATGSLNQNPTQFTINVWINLITDNIQGAGVVSTNGTGQTGAAFIFIQMVSSRRFQFNNAVSSATSALNTWYMVTAVQTATQQSIYVNNTLANTATASGSLGTNYVVSRRWDGLYLNSRIGSVQIYNRVLSTTEITQNYNALKGRYGL